MNYREAQDKGKNFHYAWFLLSILLVATKLPKGSQFPKIKKNLPEAMRNNLLWETKDFMQVCVIKVFWIFMESSIETWIDFRPWLSQIVYNTLQSVAEFKVNMHNVYIQAWKDPAWQWVKLPFIATHDAIFEVMTTWPLEWHAPDLAKLDKIATQ